MDALESLLDNEKGLMAVLLLIGATVLVALGKMTVDDWKSFAQWVFGIYAGSTAVHQSALALSGKSADKPADKPAAPSEPAKTEVKS